MDNLAHAHTDTTESSLPAQGTELTLVGSGDAAPAAGDEWKVASGGERVVAGLIDAGILLIPTVLGAIIPFIGFFIAFTVSFAYFAFTMAMAGRTVGAMAMGLRPVNADGSDFGTGGALKWTLARTSVEFPLIIPWVGTALYLITWSAYMLPVLVTDSHRGLHDKMSGVAWVSKKG